MENKTNTPNKTLSLSERIRQIREYRGLKQITVANEMHISQQAYSNLERKAGNLKMDTLKKFCAVVNVDIAFLLAADIPVTVENINTFDQLNFSKVFNDFKSLKAKAEAYESLLQRKHEMDNSFTR